MILQSQHAKARVTTPVNFSSGTVNNVSTFVDLAAGSAADDILELLVLPHRCRLISFTVETVAIAGASNISIGTLTGDYRDITSTDRVFDPSILSGVAKNEQHDAAISGLSALGTVDEDTTIAAKLSANEAAGAALVYISASYVNS